MLLCSFDIDGTITKHGSFGVSQFRMPWSVIRFFLRIYEPPIRKEMVDHMHLCKRRGDEVIIITARPEEVKDLTIRYLKKNKVPFDKIFFVGPGPHVAVRKVEKAKQEKVEVLYDNSREVLKKAKKEGIIASLAHSSRA